MRCRSNDPHRLTKGELANVMAETRYDADRFIKANSFLQTLRRSAAYLSGGQYSDLRQQALNGDVKGAEAGLEDVLRKRGIIISGAINAVGRGAQ